MMTQTASQRTHSQKCGCRVCTEEDLFFPSWTHSKITVKAEQMKDPPLFFSETGKRADSPYAKTPRESLDAEVEDEEIDHQGYFCQKYDMLYQIPASSHLQTVEPRKETPLFPLLETPQEVPTYF